jgi:hypothetical protein
VPPGARRVERWRRGRRFGRPASRATLNQPSRPAPDRLRRTTGQSDRACGIVPASVRRAGWAEAYPCEPVARGGVNIKAVSSRLGHRSAALALSTYAHLLPAGDWDAAQRIDDLLSGSKRVANPARLAYLCRDLTKDKE